MERRVIESIVQDELLSLIHSITGEKESLQKTKLAKVKVSSFLPSIMPSVINDGVRQRPPPLAIAQKKKVDKVAAKKLEFVSSSLRSLSPTSSHLNNH